MLLSVELLCFALPQGAKGEISTSLGIVKGCLSGALTRGSLSRLLEEQAGLLPTKPSSPPHITIIAAPVTHCGNTGWPQDVPHPHSTSASFYTLITRGLRALGLVDVQRQLVYLPCRSRPSQKPWFVGWRHRITGTKGERASM